MRIIAVTQARMGSSRLPGKILKKISGITLLELHIQRILKSKKIDQLILATTTNQEDAGIVEIGDKCGIQSYCGSVDDVLDRFYQALKMIKPDYVVRLTSDCPLIDAELIDKIIEFTIEKKLDYCSNTLDPKYPDGQDVEVFSYSALEKAWSNAQLISEREHVTPYIWKNSSFKGAALFQSANFSEGYEFGHLRMTVDEPQDFEVVTKLISDLGTECSWTEYANYLETTEKVNEINKSISRNEGYSKSINKEK